jgi:uncharacterized protein (DUF433 family)
MQVQAKEETSLAVLGHGAYSLSEVARYAEMSPSTIREWFRGRSDGAGRGPVLASDYAAIGKDYAVSFLDLVDAYVAARFREAGVRMSIVRTAYDVLAADLRTVHPFAHGELYTDGKSVIVAAASKICDRVFYNAISKQLFFDDLKSYLDRIDYRSDTQLARRWRISEGVMIDPKICFGKPTIAGTGTRTAIVARHYLANRRNAVLVGDLFGIGEQDVQNAVQFEESLGKLQAA